MNKKKNIIFFIVFSLLFATQFSFSQKIYEDAKSSLSGGDDINSARQNAITRASAKSRPAIVGINVTAIEQVNSPYMNDPFFSFFFGENYSKSYRKVHGLGSGFIVSPDGYIITNHHVAGNAKEIIVTLTSGEKYPAKIIGSDMTSDVALLKIDAKNLPYLKLANSDDLIIGEWVIAMGNPFGLFDMNSKPTVTVGVVSNLDLNMINEDSPYDRVYKGMIQTDAAISSGNSGGPLLNANGDVIGMNTVIFSTSQNMQGAGSIGIGFAIPVNRIKKIVDMLKTGKSIDRSTYIGMEIDEINERAVKYYNLDKNEGFFVTRIFRNSPAEKAGIELGDIILSINGTKIFRSEDYFIELLDTKVGDKLTFELLSHNKIVKKDVILESLKR
jgi:serine protease Do